VEPAEQILEQVRSAIVDVLEPPLFDPALGTDHAFVMQIQFGTVFDAFVSYSYQWDRIRVPEQRRGTDVSDLQGERPGWGSPRRHWAGSAWAGR